MFAYSNLFAIHSNRNLFLLRPPTPATTSSGFTFDGSAVAASLYLTPPPSFTAVFTTREINKKLCIWLIPVEWHWLHCPRHSLLFMAGGCQKLIPLCQRRKKRPQYWWVVKKVIFFYINLSFVCTWQDANVELSLRRANYCFSSSARRITLFRLTGFDDDVGGVE